ncbi:MAG: hypothetical protein NTV51_12340 [Verrucomicrobia bacterium]|nr:hypothetical protein [Verrucomicrobiota bacterium]
MLLLHRCNESEDGAKVNQSGLRRWCNEAKRGGGEYPNHLSHISLVGGFDLMAKKKRYELTAARIPWHQLETEAIVVLIPWDEFCLQGGPDAYLIQFSGVDARVAIVAKSPEGKWGSATLTEGVFERMWKENPLDSLRWHQMTMETEFHPRDLFGRL